MALLLYAVKWPRGWSESIYDSFSHLDRIWVSTHAGSLYLRSLYARLVECVNKVLQSVGRYDVFTHVDSSFL